MNQLTNKLPLKFICRYIYNISVGYIGELKTQTIAYPCCEPVYIFKMSYDPEAGEITQQDHLLFL